MVKALLAPKLVDAKSLKSNLKDPLGGSIVAHGSRASIPLLDVEQPMPA